MTKHTIKRITFIGECRSLTAIRKGWSWIDGRLAAKPLFEALAAMGIDPTAHEFINLFTDPPITRRHLKGWRPKVQDGLAASLKTCAKVRIYVALGQRVSRELTRLGIDHVALVHPAARGRIRLRRRYIKHVQDTLGPVLKVRTK